MKSALDEGTALVAGTSDDAKASYGQLERSVSASKKEYTDAEKAVGKLDAASDKYFGAWEKSASTMNDIDRETSATLQDDVWGSFQEARDDGRVIAESNLHPLLVDLEKLLKDIDGKLDAASLAKQKDTVDELNDKAKTWFADNAKRHNRVKDSLATLTER